MTETQPELPVDPGDVPVDHVENIRELLSDIDHEASKLKTTTKMRSMFGCGVQALEEMLEVME